MKGVRHPCMGDGAARRVLALVLLLPLLGACTTMEDFRATESPFLATAETLPVTISPELQGFRKKADNTSDKTTYKIGKLLRRIFPAKDGRSFLSLVASRLDVNANGDGTWSTSFELSVALQREGAIHMIAARGAEPVAETSTLAAKRAIERGVEDLYRQVYPLLGPAGRDR